MPIQITEDMLRAVYPAAKRGYAQAFAQKGQAILDKHGISETRTRLAFFLAQVGHESSGLTITEENMSYTARRMTQVWPRRFPTVASAAPYAHNPRGLANKTYGGRMGNRPGTNDGYDYRGSGPIQITGRDGFAHVGAIAGLPLEDNPNMARDPVNGADIAAAFWSWKKLNPVCDTGNFTRCTKLINGGTIGMADRQAWLRRVKPIVDKANGGPSTPKPPEKVIRDATRREQGAAAGGAATTTGSTQIPQADGGVSLAAWIGIGVGVVIVVVALIAYLRNRKLIAENWK